MRISNADTIAELFQKRLDLSPDKVAYRQCVDGEWKSMTWREVAAGAGRWQEAFRRQGLSMGDRVAICMANCSEWVFFDIAAMCMGLVSVPLFYNDRPDNMAYCLNHAGAKFLFVADGDMWPELEPLLETVETAICLKRDMMDSKIQDAEKWLPESGELQFNDAVLKDSIASLVYTSGTTGRPKGVMLSHYNIGSNLEGLIHACPEITEHDRFLSFLPLSHMLERTVGYYVAMMVGAETVFARGILELSEDMVSQRPTILVCVPRIFERIYGKVQEGLAQKSLKRTLFESAVETGWRHYEDEMSFKDKLLHPVLDTLVGKKLRARLGGRVRFILLGGAPMPKHLFKTFIGLGIKFLHGYGLTETSPVISFNRVNDNDPFSVGRPLEGVEVKRADSGELVTHGPNIMKGYWKNEKATEEAIDTDGWFHTGDIVEIRGGRIYITDRLKDVMVMSNGEKVPPADVEQAILADAVFEQVMVIGEGRPKLGLVVVSQLDNEKELCERANKQLHAFPGYTKICFLRRFSEPWTVENGLLTPSMKIKRPKVEEKYAKEIEDMFAGDEAC